MLHCDIVSVQHSASASVLHNMVVTPSHGSAGMSEVTKLTVHERNGQGQQQGAARPGSSLLHMGVTGLKACLTAHTHCGVAHHHQSRSPAQFPSRPCPASSSTGAAWWWHGTWSQRQGWCQK